MKDKRKIGEMLIEAGLIDELQLMAALGEQRQWGGRLCSIILKRGFVDEKSVAAVLEKQLGEESISLDEREIPPEALKAVKPDIAKKYHIIPVDLEKGILTIATSDPTDLSTIDELAFISGLRIRPVLALESGINRAIERCYEGIDRRVGTTITAPEQIEIMRSGYEISASPSSQTVTEYREEEVPPSILFKALSEILVKKGILTREEIDARIKETMRNE